MHKNEKYYIIIYYYYYVGIIIRINLLLSLV